ncbi:MAG: transpeptidase family protein [Proteobacteria bacterium]|nr:transpeptidase family protein [Pseudomonadota bacterium]
MSKHSIKLNGKKIRIGLFGATIVLLYFLAFYKLVDVQILKRDFYLYKLSRQYENTYYGSKVRGNIYDRNGNELAISVLSFSVYVNKNKITDLDKFANTISKILNTTPEKIKRSVTESEQKGFFIVRKSEDRALKEEFRKIKGEKIEGISGAIEIVEESKRFYPYKDLASHIIGFANDDNEGLEGIEYYYDKKIENNKERVSYYKDLTDGIIRTKKTFKEEKSIELTINKDIQAIVEDELKRGVIKSQGRSGVAVVMDPESGEILAMASYPDFNPNEYYKYSSNNLRNRALIDIFEPGSVLKVFLVSAALEEHLISPSTLINCENGRYRVHDRVFKEAHEKRYGTMSVKEIIKNSSNIGCIKIAEKLGKKKFHSYLEKFNFGKKTDIGLAGEPRGIVPNPKEITPVRLSTISFGQGISLNAVQIANAFCAVVNGGNLLKPRLIKRIINEDNETVYENNKEIIRRVISPKTSEILKDIMEEVVTDGTGKNAAIEGTTVIGKTGTAQKPGRRGYLDEYIASFLGAFPKDKPRYVIFVAIDSPKGVEYGGYVSAPVFREIGKRILELEGGERKVIIVKDDKEKTFQTSRSVAYSNITGDMKDKIIPDFRGLTIREAIKIANLRKIELDISGSGVVYYQDPLPVKDLNTKKVKVFLK